MMTRLNIIVEGPTEEMLVRDLLAPHLGQHRVFATARSAETGRRKSQIFRGGLVRYAKVRKDIESWLKQDSGALVSTMFDYYALPEDFPRPDAPQGSIPIHQWVLQLDKSSNSASSALLSRRPSRGMADPAGDPHLPELRCCPA